MDIGVYPGRSWQRLTPARIAVGWYSSEINTAVVAQRRGRRYVSFIVQKKTMMSVRRLLAANTQTWYETRGAMMMVVHAETKAFYSTGTQDISTRADTHRSQNLSCTIVKDSELHKSLILQQHMYTTNPLTLQSEFSKELSLLASVARSLLLP